MIALARSAAALVLGLTLALGAALPGARAATPEIAAAIAALPDWLPLYPGAVPTPASARTGEGADGSTLVDAATQDPPAKVAAFYKAKLAAHGAVDDTEDEGVRLLYVDLKSGGSVEITVYVSPETGATGFTINYAAP